MYSLFLNGCAGESAAVLAPSPVGHVGDWRERCASLGGAQPQRGRLLRLLICFSAPCDQRLTPPTSQLCKRTWGWGGVGWGTTQSFPFCVCSEHTQRELGRFFRPVDAGSTANGHTCHQGHGQPTLVLLASREMLRPFPGLCKEEVFFAGLCT